MPGGYLFTVALVALATLVALVPLRRPQALARKTWLAGTVVGELALFAFLALLADTVLAIVDGDSYSVGGWVLVGVAILTLVGHLILIRRGLQARPTLEDALSRALGERWYAMLDVAPVWRSRRAWPARVFQWPFPWVFRPRVVGRVANVRYGDAGKRNMLDVYRHRAHPQDAPTLVYVHGGGYFSGRKSREALPLLHRFASQGWVCISATYRLRPVATFPDHLVDLKKAIAWVREHSDEYGADPEMLFTAGSSAGGHLSAFAALTQNEDEFQPGFEDADTSVTAAISLYGFLGAYYGQGEASSPRTHVRADAPPFFLAQGTHDMYIPEFVEIARQFVDDLRAVSTQPVVYAELPGAQHAFDLFHSARCEAVVDAIGSFTSWVRSRREMSEPDQHAHEPAD